METSVQRPRDIATIGSIEVFSPRPDRSLWYFKDMLGMEPVHTESDPVYLRGYGAYAVSTLMLTAAKQAGVGTTAWRAVSPQALDRRVKALEAAGLGGATTSGSRCATSRGR